MMGSAWKTIGLGLCIGAALSACRVRNTDHCLHKDRPPNDWCAENHPELPFCSPCEGDNNGCVAEEPDPAECPDYVPSSSGTAGTGTAGTGTAGSGTAGTSVGTGPATTGPTGTSGATGTSQTSDTSTGTTGTTGETQGSEGTAASATTGTGTDGTGSGT